MSNACICAPARTHRVAVVGVKGCQFQSLCIMLSQYPIELRELSPDQLLRRSSLDCLVVLTRFVNHKHSRHAKCIAQDAIRVDHGAARAIADAILWYFDLVV
jgi:hypothetical protein